MKSGARFARTRSKGLGPGASAGRVSTREPQGSVQDPAIKPQGSRRLSRRTLQTLQNDPPPQAAEHPTPHQGPRTAVLAPRTWVSVQDQWLANLEIDESNSERGPLPRRRTGHLATKGLYATRSGAVKFATSHFWMPSTLPRRATRRGQSCSRGSPRPPCSRCAWPVRPSASLP
jgi:hypothetical protein